MKYEDLQLDHVFVSEPYHVPLDEILTFAEKYDYQPIHTDVDGADHLPFGNVIASGFMTIALAWRLWLDIGMQGGDGRGGIAIDDLRWSKPLFSDETVRVTVTVVDRRLTSKGRGLVRYRLRLENSESEEIIRFDTVGLIARRGEEA